MVSAETGRLEPAKDGALVAGGYANSRVQDEFCAGTDCLVTMLFDQTANVSRHNIAAVWVAFLSSGSDIVVGRATI